MFERIIQKDIEAHLPLGKIIVLYGARRVGKTTLVKEIADKHGDFVYLNCDEPNVRDRLTDKTSVEMKSFIGNAKLVIIDEAQRVRNIGLSLKLLIDTYPELRIIATGSSAFELSNSVREPLTGRTYTFHLHPLSLAEISAGISRPELDAQLAQRITYGMYPSVALRGDTLAEEEIRAITADYLSKDILAYEGIRKPELAESLAKLLAAQTGSLVSYSELANTLNVSRQTIESYIRILEQAFIIFSLTPFSGNIRTELTKKRKIYFYDTGVRNALLGLMGDINHRIDLGAVWENFVISERVKSLQNAGKYVSFHFWRTHDGQEIDLIEREGEALRAYEIKWQQPKTYRTPPKWKAKYPETTVQVITRANLLEMI